MKKNGRKGAVAGGGRPFKKGADPRRHTSGRKSKEAVELGKLLQQALIDEGRKEERFKKVAAIIWKKAENGIPFYVDLILDRILGKVAQPIEGGDKPILFRLVYDKSKSMDAK